MDQYWVSVVCSWVEPVKAKSMDEAIIKAEKKYRYGKGHIPREYIEVTPESVIDWCEIE